MALGAAHDWQPLEPERIRHLLDLENSRRIHPAAKREAREYRTSCSVCLILQWPDAKRLGTAGQTGLDWAPWNHRRRDRDARWRAAAKA